MPSLTLAYSYLQFLGKVTPATRKSSRATTVKNREWVEEQLKEYEIKRVGFYIHGFTVLDFFGILQYCALTISQCK